jgi:hypothetical protein
VADHADRGGLAVRAGDRDDRDPGRSAGGIQAVDDRPGHVPWLALGGGQVHPQARAGVDLEDGAARRGRDVGQPHVDAADIQADHGRGAAAQVGDVLVHLVGDVAAGAPGGQVGVPAQRDDLAAGRHRPRVEILRRQVIDRGWVEPDLRQRARVTFAAARVGVDLRHKLADVADAVAGHRGRAQLGRGYHPAVDDEHPVVGAR